MKRKAYVIGYGQVSAAGSQINDLKELLYTEESKLSKCQSAEFENEPIFCGQVKGKEYQEKFMYMAKTAMLQAISEAGLEIKDFQGNPKAGLLFGTSLGNTVALEKYYKEKQGAAIEPSLISYIGQQLRNILKVKGASYTLSNTCCTGISVISAARQLVMSGILDICVIGCADILGSLILSGMNALNALSKKDVLRPFAANRDGIILGEGAAFLVLANENYKNKKAVLDGCAVTNDAVHLTAPDRNAGGLVKAIQECLSEAQLAAEEIDVVFCSGNGTLYNDSMQAKAIHKVWGNLRKEPPVTSIKPLIGHTLSVSGVIETIAIIMMMGEQYVAPIGPDYIQLQEDEKIALLHQGRNMKIQNAVLLSSGFSGAQAAQVIRKWKVE